MAAGGRQRRLKEKVVWHGIALQVKLGAAEDRKGKTAGDSVTLAPPSLSSVLQ
jgi:hypothetical protein